MTHQPSPLRDLMTRTLSLVAWLDVDDAASAEHALDQLDVLISALLEHIKVDDTFLFWDLENIDAGTVQLREKRGAASRGLLALCERAAEVEIAIAERRDYRHELAHELYFMVGEVCGSLSAIAPELGLGADPERAVA